MKGIVDRIEGDFLVVELENEQMIDIPREKLRQAKEGDAIIINGDTISIDKQETKKREERIKNLFDDLLE